MARLRDIDRAIAAVGSSVDRRAAERRLLACGEPALHRLLTYWDGSLPVRFDPEMHPRDLGDNLTGALIALGRCHPEALFAAMQQKARLDCSSVVWALGEIADRRGEPLLLRALTSRDEMARWAAAVGLQKRAGAAAVEPLMRAVRDRSSSVRFAAVKALARVGDERALPVLEHARAARQNARFVGLVQQAEAAIARIKSRRRR